MRKQKIIIISILLLFFIPIAILKAENLDRIAIFPFKTDGIDRDSSFIFVELLRNEVAKLKQYEIVEYNTMNKILFEYEYKGDNLWDDEESALVMGKFLSVKKIVLGFLNKRRNIFSINIRFIDLKKEEIILDVTENFKGTFDDLLANKVPELAEMISWSTKYLYSVNTTKKNKERKSPIRKGDKASKLRILFGITSLVTAGSGVVMHYLTEEKRKESDKVEKELPEDPLEGEYNYIYKRLEDADNSADQRMKVRNVLYSLAGTSLAFFFITFFF